MKKSIYQKKGSVMFIAFLFLLSLVSGAGESKANVDQKVSPCASYGDIDDDGFVTVADYSLAFDAYGGSSITSEQETRVDVNGNGRFDADDIVKIYNYINGTIETFPACAVSKKSGCADLDASGKVDYKDLARVGSAMNTCSSDTNYNAKYDLNGDNCINQADLDIIQTNYGKMTTCAQASSCPDINSDNVINYVDLGRITSAFNTCIGDSDYDTKKDLNGDGCVNNAELIIIEKYYNVSPNTIDSCRSIKVISPNGGEKWVRGNTHNITWSMTGINKAKINLLWNEVDGSPSSYEIATIDYGSTTDSAGNLYTKPANNRYAYSWYVPSNQIVRANYRIQISDASKQYVIESGTDYDTSDNYFSIINAKTSEPICGNGVCESGESPYSCKDDCDDWEEVFDTQKCETWHAPNVFNYSPCGNTKIYNVVPGDLLKLSAYGDNCASCVCYHVNFDLYDYINGEWVKIKTVDKPDEKTGIRSIFDYTPKGNQIKIVGTNGCFHFNLYREKSGGDESSNDENQNNNSGDCLPDETLIKLPNNPKIYIIKNCQRYWIRTAEEFKREGYKWENVKISTSDVVDSLTEVSESVQDIKEGAIIRVIGDVDIYIVKYIGNKKFKRLILNPSVFRSYGHLRWEDVIEVEKETVDSFLTSNLVRNAKTGRIYNLIADGDSGIRRHFKSISAMQRLGHDLDAVYEINEADENSYDQGEDLE